MATTFPMEDSLFSTSLRKYERRQRNVLGRKWIGSRHCKKRWGEAFAFYNERATRNGKIVLLKINNPSHEVLNSLNQ
jgi:hypothetical protein